MRVGRDTNAAWRARVALTLALLMALVGLAAPSTAQATETADRSAHSLVDSGAAADASEEASTSTASLVGFNPANIISNEVFYDSSTMSQAQIGAFLRQRGSECTSSASSTCLKDYQAATYSFAGDRYCSGYSGGGTETAAAMIFKSARACGVNPQVLLVTLQKEQSLVTAARSATTYQRAMGYGCPDNAGGACDPDYAGFHVQVYYAARQYIRYGDASIFTSYPVGQVSQIKYNVPNSCGSGAVRIANQATRNLYIYTPYQPNAAALRAGWGTGDSCSAYGNRNFYNYFTDWFGSTQRTRFTLMKVGSDVFVLSGGRKLPVGPSMLGEYQRVFGAPVTVSTQYASLFETGGRVTEFVRNASTGAVSLFQGGRLHQFRSCAQVEAWGSQCEAETILAAAEYSRIPAGAIMTSFARTASGGAFHLIEGAELLPLHNAASATQLNGGSAPFAAVMPSAGRAKYTVGSVRWAPGRFVEPAGESRTYLPTWDGRLLYLPSWNYPAELGLSRTVDRGVPASSLSAYSRGETLTYFVRCGSTNYLPAGKKLTPVAADAVAGFAVTALDDRTCGVLDRSTGAEQRRAFVQGIGRNEVYVADNGQWRHVTSRAALTNLAGGTAPTALRIAAALIDSFPKGDPIRAEDTQPTMIKVGSDVFVLSGGRKLPVGPSMLGEYQRVFGAPMTVSAQYASSFETGGRVTEFVRNASTGAVSLFQGGQLHQFRSCAQVAAWGSACGSEPVLASAEYSRIPAGAIMTSFARTASGGAFHLIEGAELLPLHNAASATQLNGGSAPFAAVMPSAGRAKYTVGSVRWAPGRFVEPAGESRTYLPTWDGRLLYLPSWSYPDELGLGRTVDRGVPAGALNGYRRGESLNYFVRCGSTNYLPAQGRLIPIAAGAVAGFAVSALDDRTCGALDQIAGGEQRRAFVQGVGRNEVYVAENGLWRHVTSRAALTDLAGGVTPSVPRVAAALVDRLPKGTPLR